MPSIILKQKRNEKKPKTLRISEKKYRTLFDSNPNYTILVRIDGTLLEVNDAAANFMGQSREELIGKNFTELNLFPEKEIPLHLKQFTQVIKGNPLGPYQYRLIDKKGNERWAEGHLVPMKMDGEIYSILVIATDITEYLEIQNNLQKSLDEKEILLREIHHRVKNNLQIIASLLRLQELSVDKKTRHILKESEGRVTSMAMIHEKLYQSPNFIDINFKQYIENLVSNIITTYSNLSKIRTIMDIEDLNLNLDTAIPLGLIVNELVTNSVKHAFSDDMTGEIKISLQRGRADYNLIVEDNGSGLPPNLDFRKTQTLGLQLVNSLIGQIDGQITLDQTQGTRFNITFKELEHKERI